MAFRTGNVFMSQRLCNVQRFTVITLALLSMMGCQSMSDSFRALRSVSYCATCDPLNGVVSGVQFGADEHALNEEARRSLDVIVEALQSELDVVIAIEGHTDNRGNARDNLELSKKRVMSVARYLVVNGISAARLRPHGFGESRPLVSNADEEGRRMNRRIEVRRLEL